MGKQGELSAWLLVDAYVNVVSCVGHRRR